MPGAIVAPGAIVEMGTAPVIGTGCMAAVDGTELSCMPTCCVGAAVQRSGTLGDAGAADTSLGVEAAGCSLGVEAAGCSVWVAPTTMGGMACALAPGVEPCECGCGGATDTVVATVMLLGAPPRGSAEEDWAPLPVPAVTIVWMWAGGPGTRGERSAPPMGGDAQLVAAPGCGCGARAAGCIDNEVPVLSRRLGCMATLVPGEAGRPRGDTGCNATICVGGSGTMGERPPEGERDCAPPTLPE